jgi:hypothetical protein
MRCCSRPKVGAAVPVQRDQFAVDDHALPELECGDLGVRTGDIAVVAAVQAQTAGSCIADGAYTVELDLEGPPGPDRNRTGRGEHRPDQPTGRRSQSRRCPLGHLRSVRRDPPIDQTTTAQPPHDHPDVRERTASGIRPGRRGVSLAFRAGGLVRAGVYGSVACDGGGLAGADSPRTTTPSGHHSTCADQRRQDLVS